MESKTVKKNFIDFAGTWSFMSDKRAKQIENTVKKVRKNWRKKVP